MPVDEDTDHESPVQLCWMCKQHLPLDQFHKNQTHCKDCFREYRRRWIETLYERGYRKRRAG